MRAYYWWALPLALVFWTGCSSPTSANNGPPQAKVQTAPDPMLVEWTHPERVPLAKVERRMAPDQLTVNCVAAPDVERTVHVYSLAGGRVVDIRARLGDEVAKGQVLLLINSADLAQAISDYKKAQTDEALANKAVDRAQSLYAHGALAEKDLEQAQDTEQKALVDVGSARERIRLLGGDLERLSPVIEVKSPIAGTIVEQNTAGGEGVKSLDNSPNLFTVADLSRVWMLCDVYENDLAQVHLGDFGEVRLSAYPDRPLRGRVSNIGRILDPNTRSAKVRVEMDNPRGMLRPGMFATAKFVSQTSRERMVVPASAILRLHDKDWVFRREGERRFRRMEVRAGPAGADGRQEILPGALKPGDEIAANALQFSSAIEPM
jgi:cobalt-zinc-cadmium efflux system membrane fusion protein